MPSLKVFLILKVFFILPPFIVFFHPLKESLEARAAANAEMVVGRGAREQGVAQPAEVRSTFGACHLVAPFRFLQAFHTQDFLLKQLLTETTYILNLKKKKKKKKKQKKLDKQMPN